MGCTQGRDHTDAMKLDIGSALARSGMTQTALADAIDVKKGFMSEIISGKKSPSLETLIRIAQALGVTMAELFIDEGRASTAAPERKFTGMSDEAVPFDWQDFRDRSRSTNAIEAAQSGLRHPETYRIPAAIGWLALMAGDILIVDLARPAKDGDLILVGLTDADGFNARTLVRRARGTFAMSSDPGADDPVLDLQSGHPAAWRATVCAVVRLLD